jgi:hypothetical protein
LAQSAAQPVEQCEVPQSFIDTDIELPAVTKQITEQHRLDISVIGTGSSAIAGPDGAHYSYPAQLADTLRARLSGIEIKVNAHVQSRETTATMVKDIEKIVAEDKPALVIWQAGTADAISGVEPEEFRSNLDEGVDKLQSAGVDVILMNMQYSPRTDSMLDVSAYADVMKWVAQQRSAILFDRLGMMHYWADSGVFDLYAATKKYDMARHVHECIGHVLASQIINAAHLNAVRMQTTR